MKDVISLTLQGTSSCGDAGVDPAEPDGEPDAGDLVDASGPDASPCATWWRDVDQDGFGDPLDSMQSCTQPSGYVSNSEDCADADPALRPGAAELCDLIDSDCDGTTTDGCPDECIPTGFAGRLYLVCAKKANWSDAALACTNAAMALVQIDSEAENEFLSRECFPLLGAEPSLWVGASDTAEEGVWRWTSGTVFWRGASAASGGMAESSAYTKWKSTEPNGGTSESCAQLRSGSLWNDAVCAALGPFVCEQVL